jgi:hypothetical protein
MKLYWDTEQKQIRHKFHCDTCGTPTICVCYDKLFEAIEGVESGMLCNKCTLMEHIKDGNVLLSSIFDVINAEQEQTILLFVAGLLDEKQLSEMVSDINENDDRDCVGMVCKV